MNKKRNRVISLIVSFCMLTVTILTCAPTLVTKAEGTSEDSLAGYTVTLGENIGVNFYMNLSEATLTDTGASMKFTMPNNETETIAISNGVNTDYGYRFTVNLAAKEMTHKIQATLVTTSTQKVCGSYSVEDYMFAIMTDAEAYGAEAVALATAALNYGGSAQTMFGYETDKSANKYLSTAARQISDVTADLSDYARSVSGAAVTDVAYAGTTTVWKDTTYIRHYFTGTGLEDATFTVDGEAATLQSGGKYGSYIEITGILPGDMSKMFEVIISKGEETQTIKYGVYSYIYSILNSETASEDVKTAMKAAYHYSQAAMTYAASIDMINGYTVKAGSFDSTSDYISPLTQGSVAFKQSPTSDANGYGTYTVEYTRTDNVNARVGIIIAGDGTSTTGNYYILELGANRIGLYYMKADGTGPSRFVIFNISDNFTNFDTSAKHTCVVTYGEGGKFSLTLDGKTLTNGTLNNTTDGISSSDVTLARNSGETGGGYYGVTNTKGQEADLKIYSLEYKTMLDDYTVKAGTFDSTSDYISPLTQGSVAFKQSPTSDANGYGTYTVEYTRTDTINSRVGIIIAGDGTSTTGNYYILELGANRIGLYYMKADGTGPSRFVIFNISDNFTNFDTSAKHTCVVTYGEGGKFSLTLDGNTLNTTDGISSSDVTLARDSGETGGGYYGVTNTASQTVDLKIYSMEYEPDYTIAAGSFAPTADYISPLTAGSVAYKKTQASDNDGYGTYTVKYKRTDTEVQRVGVVFGSNGSGELKASYLLVLRSDVVGIYSYNDNGEMKGNYFFKVYDGFKTEDIHTCVVTYSGSSDSSTPNFSLTLDGRVLQANSGNSTSDAFYVGGTSGKYYGVANENGSTTTDLKIYSLAYTAPTASE